MAWASAASAQVKISQLYGSGGNAQAPVLNDYMEIYNSGAPQLLTGWSVQYASDTGTTWTVTALPSITLGTGQYLLVQQGTGGTIGAGQTPALPTPNATAAVAMAAAAFKVALVSSTTALVGGVPTYTGSPTLVDFVGAGTTANWNDTAAAGGAFAAANNAPVPSTAHAIYRVGCGATDSCATTGACISRADWAVGWPAPRNTSTALNLGLSVVGSALPLTLEELQSVRLTATPFRCATNDLGAGTAVSVDATLIGAGVVAMLDGGAAPDEVAGDGIYTALVTVAGGTVAGTKNLPVTVSDGGGFSGGSYLSIEVKPTTTPDNDNCTGAAPLVVPSTTSGTFTGATVESNPFATFSAAPTTGMTSRRGLWYTVVGTGNTMTASLCATLPALDSVMAVFCGPCDGPTVIATGDDGGPACTGSAASARWCSALGTTYTIWISPFATGASTVAFTLNISDDATPCATAFPCTSCLGVAGPYTETEPGYGPHTNDGCSSTPNLFTTIAAPGPIASVIRGSGRGIVGNRDVDSYRFQATASGVISMTLDTLGTNAQAQLNSLAAGGVCPQVSVVNTPIFVTRCATGIQTSAAANVTAGTWYTINVLGGVGIQVTTPATVFGGQMPGGTTYQYTLNVSITPVGACCFPDGTCNVGIESACTSPGVYQGNDTACHSIVTGANVLEDITTDPLATQLALGDDASSGSITLPFVFNYFGNNRSSVFINSNGWLSFNANAAITTLQMRTNLAMPSGVALPNELIAPYWDDMNQVTATADRISYMTRGTAPSRRFIVQWLVRIFNGTNPACVNFEAILYEGTNCIEFRYATVLPNGSLCGTAGTASYNAGLESLSGLVGANVTNLVASNTSILFCPTCPLPTGSCCVPLTACQILTQTDCLTAGGTYNGDNTSCTPDPCVTGACCLPLGGCQDDVTPTACTNLSGTYRGDFSTCATVNPPCPPSGTCCSATGSCSTSTQANCSAPDQTWTLGGSCTPNPCQTGACCLTNGSCLIRTANGCSALSGCYQGDTTLCTGGPVTNYSGGGTPVNIPDNNLTGVVLTRVITDSYFISDLDFGFTFGSPLHTWYDDVNMSLKHVDTGTTRLLMNANGTDNSDLCGPYTLDDSAATTFDAAATAEATGTACIPTGSYRPDNLLSGFNGENINGTWELTVWDDAGSDTGMLQNWSLSVTASPCPAISQQPANVTGCESGSASFSVVATGASLTYQWRKGGNPIFNGGNISGADTASLTINPVGAGDAGSYDVVVTSGACSVTSTPASLTVNSTPTIVTQPAGGAVAYGSPFSFTVGASGGGLSYQWYRDGVPLVDGGTISGATTATLSISATVREDSGSYTVVVTNICGTITSEPAFLEVNGNATVSLVSPPCANTGQLVVDVLMSSSTSVVVGGQFFLAYDIALLDFVSAVPGDAPFITEVYETVNEPAGEINYAVGIDDEGGTGTSANTVMARLTFNVLQDDCDLTPNLVTWRASGPNGAESKLSNSMGLQVNINPVNLGPTQLDNTDPVITVCPSNINVHAAAGSCSSAPVTYAAAASDNCTANPTIVFNPPSGSTFPPGTTPVLVTATDECGNSSTCTFNVINDGMVEMNVEVELGGGQMANGGFTRGITFALWNATDNVNPLFTTCVTMSFSSDFPVPKTATATFLAPCQPTGYDCITARDRLHTLRRTISPVPISGVAYAPSFTTAKALVGGNLDDSKFIDIIDFGIYTTQDLTIAPGGVNTVCGQNPPGFLHADINGTSTGVVNSLDYSFIANNFLMTRDNNCNGSTITVVTTDGSTGPREKDQPITTITIAQLNERGLGNLTVMDLNQDGVFDLADKGLWEQGVRPNTTGTPGPIGGAPKSSQPLNLDTLPNPVP